MSGWEKPHELDVDFFVLDDSGSFRLLRGMFLVYAATRQAAEVTAQIRMQTILDAAGIPWRETQ